MRHGDDENRQGQQRTDDRAPEERPRLGRVDLAVRTMSMMHRRLR